MAAKWQDLPQRTWINQHPLRDGQPLVWKAIVLKKKKKRWSLKKLVVNSVMYLIQGRSKKSTKQWFILWAPQVVAPSHIIAIIAFLFPYEPFRWSWPSYVELIMFHRHVSTVAQNGQTKHWLWSGPFEFFMTTVSSPKCFEGEGWVEGCSVGCTLQSHNQMPLNHTL